MKQIIHVDNSGFFRKIMKTFLEAEGFEVESFDSAQEANIAIGGGFADLVIMGLAFQDMDGKEFLAKTVEAFAGPVIIVSSSSDEQRTNELLSLGARAVVSKSGSWKEDLRSHLSMLV
jgi:DNA-binding response OmpR family regulator